MPQTISVEKEDRIARVTLDRPESLNAVSKEMQEELTDAFYELGRDDETRVIVLSGNGESFCAGADLEEESQHEYDSLQEYLDKPSTFDAIGSCPQPVISAVHGWAIGAGFHYPLWGDIIYAAESAKFKLPQVDLGIMPAYVGAIQLYRFVGKGATSEAALLGEPIDSEEAHRLGLVQEVLPDRESLLDYAMDRAHALAEKPPASVRLTKESIQSGMDIPLSHAGLTDKYRFYALTETQASKEIHDEQQERHSS